MTGQSIAVAALRSQPVTALSRLLTRGKLRILAYHGVLDAALFAAQMDYLAGTFQPVHEDDVAAAMRGKKVYLGARLGSRSTMTTPPSWQTACRLWRG